MEKESGESGVSPEFVQEIKEWIEQEHSGLKESKHLTYENFDPNNLRREDEEIWEKVKNKTITREEFSEYRRIARELAQNGSVQIFSSFIANRAMPVIIRKEMAEKVIE